MKPMIFLLIVSAALGATEGEMAVQSAKAEIAKHAGYAPSHNALAMAYVQRANETADAGYYGKADAALQECFQLEPQLYEGMKTEVLIQLGRHEYAKALQNAIELNKKTPDDVAVYGYLVDADVALGNYKDAVKAAQWMLDLRPGNIPGLSHAGLLRELHGNLAGALDILGMAYGSLPTAAVAERAAMLARIAHVNLMMGDLAKAEKQAGQALEIFPGAYAALAELARVRVAQKRYDDAVKLLDQLCDATPRGEYLYARAEALELAGRSEQSSKALAEFERKALAETNLADNSNRELSAYYANHAHQPAKALEVARRELGRRKDVFTLDSYAWALAAGGDYQAANAQIHKALQIGVKDPVILAHAASIAESVEQRRKVVSAAR